MLANETCDGVYDSSKELLARLQLVVPMLAQEAVEAIQDFCLYSQFPQSVGLHSVVLNVVALSSMGVLRYNCRIIQLRDACRIVQAPAEEWLLLVKREWNVTRDLCEGNCEVSLSDET